MALPDDHTLPGSIGIVVCGGESRRMGIDKSLLQYYEKPQRYHVYEMLQPFCEKVFISCNEAQVNTLEEGYSFLTDDPAYKNIGPMAALLSAFTQFPGKNILFIGCDYPFLSATDLQDFLTHCKDAPVSFYNEQEELYEPLLAWYPNQSFDELKKMFETKEYSLQQFLRNIQAAKFYPANKKSIMSIDTKEDFSKAHKAINPSYLKNFF
ncbi:MAG: molybdenum cofactor guanylyltransferase [Ferruginibacter sp.]